MPIQAREVAHSGHTSHLLFLSSFPFSAFSTLRPGKGRRGFAEVAFLPVIGVVASEFAGDRHGLPPISTQHRESQQDRANTGSHRILILQVSTVVFGQNRPEILTRVSIPAHPDAARNFVAQLQDTPVTVVRNGQQSTHVALVEGNGFAVATISGEDLGEVVAHYQRRRVALLALPLQSRQELAVHARNLLPSTRMFLRHHGTIADGDGDIRVDAQAVLHIG